MKLLYIAAIIAAVLALSTGAYAEVILECPQHNGPTLYTNKDVEGCMVAILPPLSIVPSLDRMPTYVAPIKVPQAPSTVVTPAPLGVRICQLYAEWVALSERTLGGFAQNTVQDTQRRLVLMQLFGSGFVPFNCQQ